MCCVSCYRIMNVDSGRKIEMFFNWENFDLIENCFQLIKLKFKVKNIKAYAIKSVICWTQFFMIKNKINIKENEFKEHKFFFANSILGKQDRDRDKSNWILYEIRLSYKKIQQKKKQTVFRLYFETKNCILKTNFQLWSLW
jgi:hypothetical protein